MITYLRMENFRRHATTEIHFDRDTQLTLISGENGAGKSTVIEGILYALYGEGRHGRRRLGAMIRQGAELEGLTVELRFEVDGSEYQVIRRREGRSSTAVLYGEGVPLYESPTAVTSAVSQILGMDAAGFRLAVYAQQKELDGLAAESAAQRKKMISRLLRLDVVTAARDASRSELNTTREILVALGPAVQISEAESRVAAAVKTAAASEKAKTAAEQSLTALRKRESELSDAEERAGELSRRRASLEERRDNHLRAVAKYQSELADLGDAPAVRSAPDTDAARSELRRAEAELTRAEERETAAQRAAVMARELERDRERLREISAALDELADEAAVADATATTQSAQKTLTAAKERLAVADRERARLAGAVAGLEERIRRVSELGDVCDQCGQDVDETHRHQAGETLRQELQTARETLVEAEAAWRSAAKDASVAESELEAAVAAEADLRTQLSRRETFADEKKRLDRRVKVYRNGQEKPHDTVDVKAAAAAVEQAEAKLREATARDAEKLQLDEWQRETERLQQLVVTERDNSEQVAKELAGCEADKDLEAQLQELTEVRRSIEAETEVLSALRVEVAVADANVEAARERLSEATAQAERRAATETEGAVLAHVAEVLDELRNRMVTEIRPALESAVSNTLDRLSEGRFPQVRFSDDYEIEVDDRGQWQSMLELSGGETDLVALAVRLGLAELIAERHGGGGVGFLILDECFGSQDPARRQAILSGIRNLRTAYGQIFLISHVGGLEDHVDHVLEVTLAEDGVADVHAA